MNRHVLFPLFVLLSGPPDTVRVADATTLPGITNEFRFDDGRGTIAVDSVGANQAMLHNFGAGDAQWIPGVFGGALNFTNENAYVITDSPIPGGSANQFSISFWSRLESRPNVYDSVLATPQTANLITYNPTGNTNSLGKKGIGIGSVRDPSEPLLGVWENYVITYDRPSAVASVYRGGALRDTGDVTIPVLNTQWVFGHNQDPGNTNGSWHGALDEIQFYDRVLTVSEIQLLVSVPHPQGDFNRDGIVDASDYIVWRKHLGQIVPACSGADANCNTFVEASEFDVWRSNFGSSSAIGHGNENRQTTANAPEATTFLLSMLGTICVIFVRRGEKRFNTSELLGSKRVLLWRRHAGSQMMAKRAAPTLGRLCITLLRAFHGRAPSGRRN